MSPLMRLVLRLALLLAALSPLLAAADPPARVGRLSLIEGHVTFRTDRQDAGAPATSNWPISSGAILDTDRDGRTEVWIGSSTFRLNGDSRLEFSAVDDQHVALLLGQGTLAVTVRDRDQATTIDVGTPAGQVRFGAPGRYRIDIDENSGDTKVTSRDGVAYIYRPGGELAVSSGQRAVAYASGGWFVTEQRPDAFDDWADARDSRSHASTARRYVSPYMTGYEDLDRYGSWSSTPDYGQVWFPSAVPAGWAPYRYGRWAWIPPWGWTWIDEAPWGFAPFHYGRWVLVGGQWAWVPGTYTPRPVYAPALVAWIGSPGWSVGFSFGSAPAVGWFPLAPYEVFVPGYRCSPTYIRQVNVTNVTNVTVVDRVVAGRDKLAFMNRNLPQAVTVVPTKTVQSGSLITSAEIRRPDRKELAQAPVALRAPETTWLPPASSALRPHQDKATLVQPALSPRPDATFSKHWASPSDPAPITSERLPPASQTQTIQPSPALPSATMRAPATRPQESEPSPLVGRPFNKSDRIQQQSDPTVVQPPVRPQPSAVAPSTVVTPKALPEPPRTETPTAHREFPLPIVPPAFERPATEKRSMPPAAVQVQPSPAYSAPSMPSAKMPAVREATPPSMPTPSVPVVRQAQPREQRQETPDNRRERAKMLGVPQ